METEKTIAILNRMLFAMLGSKDLVDGWWKGPNRAFDFKCPAEVFDVEPDKVISYILNHYQR